MAGTMFVQMHASASTNDAAVYHANIAAAVTRIPIRFGGWEGSDIKVPVPAAKLLRPNALFARRYDNQHSGRVASLVLVHCTDSRDMSGHYPPNCYPATGWTPSGPSQSIEVSLGKASIPMVVYNFSRTEFNTVRHTVIYNFFILPSGMVTGMDEVQRASGDRRVRPYGAAQVQIIMDSATPERARQDIVGELLEPLTPVIELLQSKKQGDRS